MAPETYASKKLVWSRAIIAVFLCAFLFGAVCLLCFNADYCHAAKKKKKAAAKKIQQDEYAGSEIIADDVFIYKKGISFYENSDYSKAIEYFKYIKEKRPASFYYDMSIYLCGESFKKLGRNDEAIENYLYLAEKCPSSTLCAEAIHSVADLYKKNGVSGEAIKFYRKLINSYPDSFWADEARAFLKYNSADASGEKPPSYSTRRSEEARDMTLEKKDGTRQGGSSPNSAAAGSSVSLDALNSPEAFNFGSLDIDSYISGGKQYEPVGYADEDLKLYRDGLKFHEYKNYDKAKWCYQKLILKYKNSLWYPNAFYMLAGCYLAEGDIKAAIRFYSAALIYARDPAFIYEIKDNLADLLFCDSQYFLALRYYESLLKNTADKERLMQLFFLIGECHTKTGNHEMAAKAYARVALESSGEPFKLEGPKPFQAETSEKLQDSAAEIKTAPGPVSVYSKTAAPQKKIDIEKGISEFNAKNYLKCISFFEQLLAENPDEARSFWYLALCYNQLEKPERASGYLQKYISILSSSKDSRESAALKHAYSTLAYIYVKMNKFEEARTQYLNIIGLDSTSRAAVSAREALKRIDVMKKRAGDSD